MNKTINNMLSKYIKAHQKDWDDYLDSIVMVYNSTTHESTGQTPNRMVYGEEMRFPLDFIADDIEDEESPTDIFATEYILDLQENLREINKLAREQLRSAAERQKFAYDHSVHSKNYEVGDLVWRNQKKNVPGKKSKIARHWTGPWIIMEKLNEVLFKIQHSKNSKPVIIHGDNLKPYNGRKKFAWFNSNHDVNDPRSMESFHEAELPNLEDFIEITQDSEVGHDEGILPPVNDDPEVSTTTNGKIGDPPGKFSGVGSPRSCWRFRTPQLA